MTSNTATHYSSFEFIINPDLEVNPHVAREEKKKGFRLSVDPTDLSTDKHWTVELLRALATGLIAQQPGGKRLKKAELVEKLTEYWHVIREQEQLRLAEVVTLGQSVNKDKLVALIESLSGLELVNAINTMIEMAGYMPSTIVKTVIPDVNHLIRAHYRGDDREFVMKQLLVPHKMTYKEVLDRKNKTISYNSENRRYLNYDKLLSWAIEVTNTLGDRTWKEIGFALAVLTGRRMCEIFGDTTVFKVSPNTLTDSDGKVWEMVSFFGQAKADKRAKKEADGVLPAFDIPVAIEADKLVFVFEYLCKVKPPLPPEKVNATYSKVFSTDLPKNLRKVWTETECTMFKDSRDGYGAKLLSLCPYNHTHNKFLGRYMGHSPDDLATSNTYQKLYIDKQSPIDL